MAATIVISVILAGLLSLAVKYVVKNGSCAGCADKNACAGKQSGSCGSGCASCSHCGVYVMPEGKTTGQEQS